MSKLLALLASLFMMFSVAHAQGPYAPPPKALLIGNTLVTLAVDGQPQEIPTPVVLALARKISGMSVEAISQQIIEELALLGHYKDIVVEKGAPTSETTLLSVSARSTWKINSVEIESSLGETQDNSKIQALIEIRPGNMILSTNSLALEAARIENALRADGYLKAQVRYHAVEKQKGTLDVVFSVTRNNPCLVADFSPRRERIPVFKSIRSGDLCNKVVIASKMREEESRIRNLGFVGARITFNPDEDLIPTSDQERATLRYTYFAGDRWFLSVVNRSTGTAVEEQFMQDTGFVLGDIAYSSHEEIRQQIETYFKNEGYADTAVSAPETVQVDQRSKRLVYELDLGTRAYIDASKVEFVGDFNFDRQEVLDYLDFSPGFFEMNEGVPFVEANLEKKRAKLVEFLIERGYLDAKVDKPEFYRSYTEQSVRLRFRIYSGHQYLVNSIALLGKPGAFEEDRSALNDLLKLGAPLQPAALKKAEGLLQSDLMSSGYRLAFVETPTRKCKNDRSSAAAKTQGNEEGVEGISLECSAGEKGKVLVDIIIKIRPGPLFRIGHLSATDVPFGKSAAVLDASGLVEGDILSPSSLAQARDRILKHGLFGNIIFQGADNITLAESEKKAREVFRDIAIVALPPRSWNLTLNPSWSSDRGYGFRSDFQRNNLTADGLQFFLQGSLSQERYQNTASNGPSAGQVPSFNLSAGLREAFFRFGKWVTPLDFNLVTVGHELEVRDERRQTSRVQSDVTWRPYWFGIEFTHRAELSYAYSGYPLGGVSQPVKVIDQSNEVGVLEVQGSSSIDTRDNPVWPRSGILLTVGTGYSGKNLGSDVEFSKYFGDGSIFFPYTRSWSQAFILGTKLITSVNAPGSRREKINAAQVRGFPAADAQLGPLLWYLEEDLDGKCVPKLTQAAATNVSAFKMETRFRRPQSSWGAVFFYDTAGAYFTSEEVRTLNDRLQALPGGSNSCPTDAARVLGNDAIDMNLQRGYMLSDYLRSSYQSAGVGLRFFVADMFAIHLDWGLPTHDPASFAKNCVPYSDPDGRTSATQSHPVAPKCVSRSPNFWLPWDSPGNYFRNTSNFLLRTQISIEGKF